MREVAGNLVYENGANDFTFDFTTNPTGPITWTLGDISGVPLIDNGIAANEFVIGTATNGEAIGAPLSVTSANILRNDSDTDWWFGNDACVTSEAIRFLSPTNQLVLYGGGVTVNMESNIFNIAGLGNGLTIHDGDFFLGVANSAQRNFRHFGTTARINIDAESLTATRGQQWADMDGVIAVWGEEVAENLTVDNAAISAGALTNGTTYVFTVAATSSWDTAPNAIFTMNAINSPALPDGVAVLIDTVAKVRAGTDFIPPNYGGSTLTPVLPVRGNYLKVTSNDTTAGNRTRAIADGLETGQMLTIEFNATANSQWELTGVLSAAGGVITWNSGAAATIQETLIVQWNGASWIVARALTTVIP